MKKLLMIGTLCLLLVAFVGTASADWPFMGTCEWLYQKIYWAGVHNGETAVADDVPAQPCEAWVNICVPTDAAPNKECFKVFCFIEGTQLNLAILKEFNLGRITSCTGSLELTPITIPGQKCVEGTPCKRQGFSCWIKSMDIPNHDDPNFTFLFGDAIIR